VIFYRTHVNLKKVTSGVLFFRIIPVRGTEEAYRIGISTAESLTNLARENTGETVTTPACYRAYSFWFLTSYMAQKQKLNS
jgi:hypothetical protein